MKISSLKDFALEKGIVLKNHNIIIKEAIEKVKNKYHFTINEIKQNFDYFFLNVRLKHIKYIWNQK